MATPAQPIELYGSALPIEIFCGRVTEMAQSGLPQGASPDCQDVIFPPGSVQTRPGLASQFAPFLGNPTVNYVKTFVDDQEIDHLLLLDSLGVMREESPAGGSVSNVGTIPSQGVIAQSDALFGREFQAFSDGILGQDIPRQFDGTNWDRVTQDGPGSAPIPSNFLPAQATVSGGGAGTPVAVSSAVTTDLTSYYVPPGGGSGGGGRQFV